MNSWLGEGKGRNIGLYLMTFVILVFLIGIDERVLKLRFWITFQLIFMLFEISYTMRTSEATSTIDAAFKLIIDDNREL